MSLKQKYEAKNGSDFDYEEKLWRGNNFFSALFINNSHTILLTIKLNCCRVFMIWLFNPPTTEENTKNYHLGSLNPYVNI